MRFIEFKNRFGGLLPVFRKTDLAKNEIKIFDYQLTIWRKKGYLKKLRNGFYLFSDSKVPSEYIANFIYAPSYISMETALFYYGILTDVPRSITSVATLKSNKFTNEMGNFIYRKIKKEAFTGYKIVKYEQYAVKIADREKALADYFYLNLKNIKKNQDFFDELRFTEDILAKEIKWGSLKKHVKLFDNKKLVNVVDQYKNYLINNQKQDAKFGAN